MQQYSGNVQDYGDNDVVSTAEEVFLMNIAAGRIVAESVRSALGPKGMKKLLVDSTGFGVVSQDGSAILEKIEVSNPIAKTILKVADSRVNNDGNISSIILLGELLKEAQRLYDDKVHPTVIARGYSMAAEEAARILDEISLDFDFEDTERLRQLAITAIGQGDNEDSQALADRVVGAIETVAEREDGECVVDPERIHIEMKEGASTRDTSLIKGMILDRRRVIPRMPRRVEDAKILLLSTPLLVRKELDASGYKVKISDPKQMKEFVEAEESHLREKLDRVVESGANVVLCEQGIDDFARDVLVENGILGVRRLKSTDMKLVSEATGARPIDDLRDLDPEEDLGHAGVVEEVRLVKSMLSFEGKMIFIRDCPNPKSVAIQVRGGSERVVSENERMVRKAINNLALAAERGQYVAGGGAPEVEIARRLRDYARKIGGKEQLAVMAFADSLEMIPRTLAINSGISHLDAVIKLTEAHENDQLWSGINPDTGEVCDMLEMGVIEPSSIKEGFIQTATDVANMLLRIDGVYASTRSE